MDCVFIGLWIFKWWQRWCADVCYLFSHGLEAIVQSVQVWVTNPNSSKASGKVRNWKVHPVTVSEYVKSWMHDGSFSMQPRPRPWMKGKGPRYKRNSTQLNCLTAVIAMKARQAHQDEAASFDTDSKAIRIDNCASYCISNDKKDFITPLKRVNKKLKGLGGTLTEIYSGTIKWSIEDDTGVPHDIVIPHGLYVKDSPSKLLSPQHWAQTAQDFKPLPRGTWCATYHDSIQLHWAQRQHTKTVRLNQGVATLQPCILLQATRLSTPSATCVRLSGTSSSTRSTRYLIPRGGLSHPPNTPVSFDLDATDRTDLPVVIDDEEDTAVHENPAAEFLRWHHKLNHMSAAKMQSMAKRGLLEEVGQVPSSNLHQLLIWKGHQKTMENQAKGWSTRWKTSNSLRAGTVHQHRSVESSTPGLIAQIKGWLTKKRYKVATIFVDHFSGLSYIHLQKSTNADETLEAKLAFERYASKFKVQVKSYQADNGRFAENKFMAAVKEAGQTITFCGVNAHFQNAVAERRIRTLQDQARTMLIHAQHRWPKAIDAHLWPYALRVANEIHNSTPTIGRVDHKSPFELFARSEVTPNLNHFQPFDFHVTFDPKFETVRQSLGNLSPPSEWQKLCGFKASSPSRLQGIKQSAQAQGLQRDVPFMEFDLEPGESVNEERLKHLKHHFQFLRENKGKNFLSNSGGPQGSTRSQGCINKSL
ncbi:hypothetical protein MHU86_9104 [Fragilaria crotonensis]|nr:hypothetical protein MHU86_9104 [Fragilaria crotonensis]